MLSNYYRNLNLESNKTGIYIPEVTTQNIPQEFGIDYHNIINYKFCKRPFVNAKQTIFAQ